ncbi:MAG: hypothetical protein AABZ47_14355 [Planctomycetota bacterium]
MALLIAIWSVMPEHRRRTALLHLTKLDWAAFIGMGFISFLLILKDQANVSPNQGNVNNGCHGTWAFIVLLLATSYLCAQGGYRKRIPPKKLKELNRLVDELLIPESFVVLNRFLDTHERILRNMQERRTWRDHIALRLKSALRLLDDVRDSETRKHFAAELPPCPKPVRWLVRSVGRLAPARTRRVTESLVARVESVANEMCDTATDVLARIGTNKPYMDYLARTNPLMGLRVFAERARQIDNEPISLLVESLLCQPHGPLARELRVVGDYVRWEPLGPELPLLHFLLSDIQLAEKVVLWGIVVEFADQHLDEKAMAPDTDTYNQEVREFHRDGKSEAPLWLGIELLFQMNLNSFYQTSNEWNGLPMGVHYFPFLAEKICRNFRTPKQRIGYSEWSNRYHYLLKDVVNKLEALVGLAHPNHGTANEPTTTIFPESIPDDAIKAVARIVKIVADAGQNVPYETKQSICQSTLLFMFGLQLPVSTRPTGNLLETELLTVSESELRSRESYWSILETSARRDDHQNYYYSELIDSFVEKIHKKNKSLS